MSSKIYQVLRKDINSTFLPGVLPLNYASYKLTAGVEPTQPGWNN